MASCASNEEDKYDNDEYRANQIIIAGEDTDISQAVQSRANLL